MMMKDQIRLSALMLLAILIAWIGSSALARTTSVISDRADREQALHSEKDGVFFYDGGYVDEGDMVLLDHLPNADFSKGGVYFVGSSEMRASIMPWILPEAEQARIHNLSIGDFRHREIEHYVRILVEDFGLLEAGGTKSTVILSSFALLARPKHLDQPIHRYVPNLFERHGQYAYDWETGIQYKDPGPVERTYRREKDLANRFLTLAFTPPESRVRPIMSMEWRLEHLEESMSPGWEDIMQVEIAHLARTLDYLLDRDVNLIVLRPPSGSWHDAFSYEETYWAQVEPLLIARDITVADFTDFLDDDEFGDDVHPRYSGQMKLHDAYRELALAELTKTGVSLP